MWGPPEDVGNGCDPGAGANEMIPIIPEFVWPGGAGEFYGAMFLSAVVYNGEMISNLAEKTFGWTEEPAATPTAAMTPSPTPTLPPTPIFAFIPSDTFQMGSPDDEMCRYGDEGPVHSVTISHGFYVQSTEVTQQQWTAVFGSNPSYFPGMDRPVEEVTWYDCCIYCNRRSIAEGLTPCYYSDEYFSTVFDGTPPVASGTVYWKQDADGYRLPT